MSLPRLLLCLPVRRFMARLTDERGITSIEYAMIAALVAMGILGSSFSIGQWVNNRFTDMNNSFPADLRAN